MLLNVDRLVRELPSQRVGMKVVPVHSQIDIENVPRIFCPLSTRIVGELPMKVRPLKQKEGQAGPAALHDAVQARPEVRPHNLAADANRHGSGREHIVADGDEDDARSTGHDVDRSRHRGAIAAAEVIVGGGKGEHGRCENGAAIPPPGGDSGAL